MDIKKFLDNRDKNGEYSVDTLIGNERMNKAHLVWRQNKELFEDISMAVFFSACLNCKFSKEEIQIYKLGIDSIANFFKECYNIVEIKDKKQK